MKHIPLFIISKSHIEQPPPSQNVIPGARITLDEKDSFHLTKILRKKKGDFADCRIPGELLLHGQIIENLPKRAVIEVKKISQTKARRNFKTGCFLALPKPKTLAAVIPKCTELGLDFLKPVITAFSSIQKARDFNRERYTRIMESSMKQCKRPDRMEIYPPESLNNVLKTLNQYVCEKDLKLFPYERETEHVLNIPENHNKNTFFFIGPEAGFRGDEAEEIIKHGFKPVSISDMILKVDTALTAVLAKIKL